MGDNKISEAAVEAVQDCIDHYDNKWIHHSIIRRALEAALPHLHGEAVPVAYIVPSAHVCHDGSMEDGPDSLCFADEAGAYVKRVGEPLFAHPQPAELNEVSGNSGELAVAAPGITDKWVIEYLDSDAHESVREAIRNAFQEWNSLADADHVQFEKAWLTATDYHAISKEAAKFIWRAALAATGKQQVGEPEIEFQSRLMDVKTDLPTENWRHSPTYEENPGRGTRYWVQYRKRYIYYTRPVQSIDLEQLVRLRNDLHAMSKHGVKDGWQDAAIELVADVTKLLDGRDAGTGDA